MRSLKTFILISFFALPGVLWAQPFGGPEPGFRPGPNEGPMREKVRQRIEMVKIWKLTEAVGLTAQQSERFFPIYNQHQKKMEEIDDRRMNLVNDLGKLLDDPKSSDKEIQQIADKLREIPQQMMSERQKFQEDISPILSVRQQMKLMLFEERFRQQLQETIREIRREFKDGRFNDKP